MIRKRVVNERSLAAERIGDLSQTIEVVVGVGRFIAQLVGEDPW
jgi:hypothetical protein